MTAARGLRVQALGPLRAWRDGAELALGPGRQRAVLGMLVLHCDRPVGQEQIIDGVWGQHPPTSAVNLVHTYVARLRRVLEPGRDQRQRSELLARENGGYRLRAGADQVDRLRFASLLARGRRARQQGDTEAALALVQEALALWQGPCVADLDPAVRSHPAVVALERDRAAATVELADLALGLARAGAAVGQLREAADRDPLDEPLHARLLLALAATSRQAEALRVFEALRERLAEELGIDPGAELRDAHRRVLRQEVTSSGNGAGPGGHHAPPRPRAGATQPVPRQLPPDVATFTGRERDLERLLAAATATPAVVAIAGPGGVGKSALAVHAAHRIAGRFPEGQLYANLHGATPGVGPLAPHEVLGRFLRALGAGDGIPADVEEAAALFRSLVAGRRLLVVLDNADDAAQVRPLLPGSPGGATLVTSRAALTAVDGATHLHLGVLGPAEAVELLGRVAGGQRAGAEPAAAARVVELCGALPLAVRIAGARLAARPGWPVRALADRLADEQRRLDELRAGDLAVRATFQVSFQALARSHDITDRGAARAFALLGLPDGPDVSLPLAARLLGRPPAEAEPVLDRLVDVQLLQSCSPGRYHMHDLVRLLAREHAAATVPPPQRSAALERLWACQVSTARRASGLIDARDPRRDGGESAWREALPLRDRATALSWLEAERANLLAAAAQAATAPATATVAIRLAQALFCFFKARAWHHDWEAINRLALGGARQLGDRDAEAQALSDLGVVAGDRYQLAAALRSLRRALAIRRETGDLVGQASTLNNLGYVYLWMDDHPAAVACLEEGLAIRRRLGDRIGQAAVLTHLGTAHARAGQLRVAIACHRRSVALFRASGGRADEGRALENLGSALRDAGDPAAMATFERALAIGRELRYNDLEACVLVNLAECYRRTGDSARAFALGEQALAIFRDIGTAYREGEALWRTGSALHDLGRAAEASARWRDALAIFERLGAPEAAKVRRLLAG